MKKDKHAQYESSRQLAAVIAKDYSQKFFTLLVMYKNISASEAATRLGLHIKTAQDFLESLEKAHILRKREALEKKRPYFRYSLENRKIQIKIDLDELYDPECLSVRQNCMIRERKNSGALFKEGRGERISSVHTFHGKGRSRTERRFTLTDSQGRFLFHLPFPTEKPQSIEVILKKTDCDQGYLPEILDMVENLIDFRIIEKLESKSAKGKFAVYYDEDQKVSKLLKQENIKKKLGRQPATLIVDKEGVIQYAHYGNGMKDIPRNEELLEVLEKINK